MAVCRSPQRVMPLIARTIHSSLHSPQKKRVCQLLCRGTRGTRQGLLHGLLTSQRYALGKRAVHNTQREQGVRRSMQVVCRRRVVHTVRSGNIGGSKLARHAFVCRQHRFFDEAGGRGATPAGERRRETVRAISELHLNGVKIHRTTTCAYSPAKLGKLMRRLEKRHQVNAGARRMGHMLGKSRDSGS